MPRPPDRNVATSRLARLTGFAQELAGSFRPATIVERLAAVVAELVAPDHLTIVLLDAPSNQLRVAHRSGTVTGRTDDPLVQLALRRGPLCFPRGVAAAAGRYGAAPGRAAPASWMGVPLIAVDRTIGAISAGADRPGAFGPAELEVLGAAAAQAAIALENARLVELLSLGKHEWELTVDAIAQAICIVDAHGRVRRANRAFSELLRIPLTTLPGRPWLELLPPAWAEVIARALARPGESAHELRAGEQVFLVSAVPMAGAEPGAAVLLFEDQTEKRRLQEQLIQSEKMSAIGQLIAGVAHDLNNPLASVVGFADFLSESGEVPPALAEPLRVIRQEAERAATIVRNLLSFARQQAERRQPQAILPILESTLALLRNQLMAYRVEATLEAEPDLPAVELNANQIKQVFVNLINNAAQAIAASGKGGRIVVTARKWLDGVAVAVTDDGPGIQEELAARVFEPFFTTKAEGQGTGLGLSISQGIVREHGGRILLDTTPGQGATFTVQLPGATRAGPPESGAPAAAPSGPLRILVVDDEPHILHYMRATLESWGHTVELATDGRGALARALAEPFDAIICDLRMPELGGRELYHELEARHPAAAGRIIFATGDTVRGDTLEFLESLGRPYLHKPFTLAELRTVLTGVARQSAAAPAAAPAPAP
ncbi:MAG TPA: ATP-binding protein, partial [Gemmatimonadales bacterium]|nr:ATP-binding protein [Gemmatimonadales bacterium]